MDLPISRGHIKYLHTQRELIFQNLSKNRKPLLAENFRNILAFESKRKSNHLYQLTVLLKNNLYMTLGSKMFLYQNRKFFGFKETPFRYYGFPLK